MNCPVQINLLVTGLVTVI